MASAERITADVPVPTPVDVPASPPVAPSRTPVPRGLLLALLGALLSYIGIQGYSLWREWSMLQGELADAQKAAVIGYINIHINPSYAQRPIDWCHDEGEVTLLWSGWKHGKGHAWFRFRRGDIDAARFSEPMGRDVVQAIDVPIVEVGDGAIWRRIPAGADVAAHEIGGVPNVYPLLLLDKVEVVNDEIGGEPYLVTYNPFAPRPNAVNIYVAEADGERVRMGVSGYFHDRKLVLYDRDTESLWVDREEGLQAVAGSRRGVTLKRAARPTLTQWGDWRNRHPRSRLIVGADRSHPPTEL